MGTNQSHYSAAAPPDTENVREVIGWANAQFEQIDTMLQRRELLPQYGGMQIRVDQGPAADQPLDAVPQILVPWVEFVPPLSRSSGPEGIIADIGAGTITFDTGTEGIYLLSWWFTVTITPGSSYRVEAFLNGNATGLIAIIDASQQTAQTNLATTAQIAVIDGDLIDLRGTADGPGGTPQTFIVDAAQFFVAKIGGRLGGALLPTP